MALFGRKRRDDSATAQPEAPNADSSLAMTDAPTDAPPDSAAETTGGAAEKIDAAVATAEEAQGPYDSAAVPSKDGYVDLGAVWMPGIQGLMLTMEVDENTGAITAVRVHLGDSLLQLQAFAAPRSSGIWSEIRDEIAEGLPAQGGTVEAIEGHFGTELLARIPARGPDGRTTTTAMRFIGIDGPRWFLRGVISGPAALDATLSQPFIELLRITAVYRDGEPRGPRELLPLQFPPEAEANEQESGTDAPAGVEGDALNEPGDAAAPGQTNTAAESAGHADTGDAATHDALARERRADDLRPFERGPEITEIR